MKRLFIIFLIFCSALVFVACKNKKDDGAVSSDSDENTESEHICNFDAIAQVKEPTCEEDGYTVYTCSCGNLKTDSRTNKLNHSWNQWEITKEPTLSNTGAIKRTCNNGHFEAITLPSLDDVNYSVTATDGQAIDARCDTPTPANYSYKNAIYDDATKTNLSLVFTADYRIAHTYGNKYTYSRTGHCKLCEICDYADIDNAVKHSMLNGKCKICSYSKSNFIYSEEDRGLAVSYNANEENVYVPEFYTDAESAPTTNRVKGIKSFKNNENLRSITIPASIEYIEAFAFDGCTSLEAVYYNGTWESWCKINFGASSNPMNYAKDFFILDGESRYVKASDVVLPDTLQTINGSAFEGFKYLSSLTIPKSITEFGSNLNGVFLPDTHISYVYYEATLLDWFNVSFKALYSNPMQFTNNFYFLDEDGERYKLTELTVPDSINEIGDYQFDGLNTLSKVRLSSNLSKIGDYAFHGCTALYEIDLVNGAESIGIRAFGDCDFLNIIVLPSNIGTVNDSAFEGCINLDSVYYNGDADSWCRIKFLSASSNPMHLNKDREYIDALDLYFRDKTDEQYYLVQKLTVSLSSDVTEIGSYQFYGFNRILKFIIPEGVTKIGTEAFAYCSPLEVLLIPKSVEFIGENALKNANPLISIFYGGSADEWLALQKASENDLLLQAKIYFCANSADLVSAEDSFWAYDSNGNIAVWKWSSEQEEWHLQLYT